MTSFSSMFESALIKLVEDRTDESIARIMKFEESSYTDGYCESCWYEEACVDIKYELTDGSIKEFTYIGEFSDLIRELTEE